MPYARMLLVALVVALTGCAATASSGDGVRRPARQQNLLTQEEVSGSQYTNLYEVVRALRPNWLRTRGQISIQDGEAGQVVIYLNGIRAGSADYLRQVGPREVLSLEYFDETQASARFGLKQGGGAAIVIHTIGGG
jgi:hypothetical protein